MNTNELRRRLGARWPFVTLAAVFAVVVGLSTLYHLGSSGLKQKTQVFASGGAQILVDSDPSSLALLGANAPVLAARAPLYAEYATSGQVVANIGRTAGIPRGTVSVSATAGQTSTPPDTNGTSTGAVGGNSVVLSANGATPIVSITTQANSVPVARRLAQATVTVLQNTIHQLQVSQRVSHLGSVVLRQLGSPSAGLVRITPKKSKAVEYAIAVFVALLLVILLVDNAVVGRATRRKGLRRRRKWLRRSEASSPQA